MTGTSAKPSAESETSGRWALLGIGGTVSLCCLFAAPAATGAAGAAVAGGTTAAIGGGVVRVLVSALTVGLIGVLLRARGDSCSCEN
ncbi:hypothetical protein ACFR9U_21200 [Halorientalis brevis]|uniref:Uncharacterized protein n=1 Tax=Halorientalis brevis TaxID=1126241 RepID=A0ABD6CGR0_9EURY|nr:hypothetical protein [Halorientalis brevis]